MKTIVALLVLATLAIAVSAKGQQYAVLLAGSNGFGNYRHQADVYHTYQILINGGLPKENIITLAYNDIANNRRNPFPGKVYNHNSGNLPGVDVYAGIQIDYEGNDVTTENYLAILRGDKGHVTGGNGRVLEAGADDEVFLFYSDHGAPGFVGMPVGKDLYADDLLSTLKFMKDNNKYNRLYYVLNACHSGSMFEELPNDWNIIAMTAANKSQSGWGTFCPPHDHINGKSLGTCLSSQFPAAFTVNSDIVNTNKETYDLQFELVAKATVSSEVQHWGDLAYGKSNYIANSIGGQNQQAKPIQDPSLFFPKALKQLQESVYPSDDSSDEQKHLEMKYLLNKYQAEPTEENYKELNDDLLKSKKFAKVFEHFAGKHGLTGEIAKTTNFNCYKRMVEDLRHQCGALNDFSRNQVKYFHHYCNVKAYEPHHHEHCFAL